MDLCPSEIAFFSIPFILVVVLHLKIFTTLSQFTSPMEKHRLEIPKLNNLVEPTSSFNNLSHWLRPNSVAQEKKRLSRIQKAVKEVKHLCLSVLSTNDCIIKIYIIICFQIDVS